MNNIKRKSALILIFTMLASGLTGCDIAVPVFNISDSSGTTEDTEITTLGLEQDFSYDRPVVNAHIEIDQLGYLTDQKKLAIFRGENLSDTFDLISADTGEKVYTGEIEEKSIQGTDEIYHYGDFSDFTEPGSYYVQTDVIGYSYKFEISDDIYDGLIADAEKQYYYNRCGYSLTSEYAGDNARNACHVDSVSLKNDAEVSLDVTGGWHTDTSYEREVTRGCDAIETMLMAYEYNTDAFTDNTGIPESGNGIPDILDEIKIETDWLLKMQDQATGAVYESVSTVDQGNGISNPSHLEDTDISSTLYFSAALGYFSYIYQNYDSAYATQCLQAADRAMKYVAKAGSSYDQNEYFRAAAMMYRATGYYNYRNIINEYMNKNPDPDISDNVVFDGCVAYLATRQKTVKNYCDAMMKNIKAFAVELSETRGDYLYLQGEELQEEDHNELLGEIARLTVVNYMISSNEYEVLMEKYLHYFLGCNPENTCYIGQYGSLNATDSDAVLDVLKQPETDAYYILLLSGIESYRIEENGNFNYDAEG